MIFNSSDRKTTNPSPSMKNKAKPIICLCCLLLPATGWAADGWQLLFNGKDLTGWKASENGLASAHHRPEGII